jgi:acyl-CoA reductase-like NAD-dependent aldehyde dehydrogenase
VADEVLERLVALASSARPGYPHDEHALLSPVLRADDYFRVLAESIDAGAELLVGGSRIDLDATRCDLGAFIAPTVLKVPGLELARTLECVRTETFYPLLPIIVPSRDHDDLLGEIVELMNGNAYGLRNSAWSSDPAVIDVLVASIRNGGLLKINESHVGFVPYMASHGGSGMTGGPFGELNYPHLRTTHLQGVTIRLPGGATPSPVPERSVQR